jgi:cysteinyl-tRNA synthetase
MNAANWVRMTTTSPPSLRILDSLAKEKTLFSTADPDGKAVTWYTCGPTVYDEPHLGHARSAVSLDILRRIMRDYFGFKVRFVMNITDVDDKIVLRGRYQYLGTRLQKEIESMERSKAAREAISVGRAAFKHYLSNHLPLLSSETTAETYSVEANRTYIDVAEGEPSDQNAKLKMHIKTCQSAAEALSVLEKAPNDPPLSDFFHRAKDVLHPYLDNLYGSTIDSQDHSIFTAVARKFEKRYFDDMHALNVLDPDVTTRATEFIPQMVTFIERIIAKGFAYPTADGSVYFDIAAFEAEGHPYPRLEPWSRNNSALRADGEGPLANKSAIKRHDVDFALWKASRPGEPAWPSPWSKAGGRPGWHIECSVMASEVLGSEIDIHSGGEDLRFPHHDNEVSLHPCKLRD